MGHRAEEKPTGRKRNVILVLKACLSKGFVFKRFATVFILGKLLLTCIWKQQAAIQLFIVNKNPSVVITCKSCPIPNC